MNKKKKLVSMDVDGKQVLFETDLTIYDSSGEPVLASHNDSEEPLRVQGKFSDILMVVEPVANQLFASLKDLNEPQEIGLEFGLKLGSKAGIVFASADAEVNFKVSLKWTAKT